MPLTIYVTTDKGVYQLAQVHADTDTDSPEDVMAVLAAAFRHLADDAELRCLLGNPDRSDP